MVESDKGFTSELAPHWQLDHYYLLSSHFVTSIFFFLKCVVKPLALCLPVSVSLQWFCWTQRQCWESWTGRPILSTGWVTSVTFLLQDIQLYTHEYNQAAIWMIYPQMKYNSLMYQACESPNQPSRVMWMWIIINVWCPDLNQAVLYLNEKLRRSKDDQLFINYSLCYLGFLFFSNASTVSKGWKN